MLFLNNEREWMWHLLAGASQHVVEEVCGVGVAVGTFWTMLSVVLTTVSWWHTVGSTVSCWVVLIKLNSIKNKWCIYWDVIINLVNKAPPSPRPGFLSSLLPSLSPPPSLPLMLPLMPLLLPSPLPLPS
jgi:hypothetical protein